jgi:hypothetical protein
MTNLSPATLAVLEAVDNVPHVYPRRIHIAEALRAVVKQCSVRNGVPISEIDAYDILAIAYELDGW